MSVCGRGFPFVGEPEIVCLKFLYVEILEKTLLPFICNIYPDSHRFMAYNNPKCTSHHAKQFLVDHNNN